MFAVVRQLVLGLVLWSALVGACEPLNSPPPGEPPLPTLDPPGERPSPSIEIPPPIR